MTRDALERVGAGVALCGWVAFALQPSWHGGLSGEDFPGHAAVLQRFLARLGAPDWLPLWTSDWSAGTSLDLQYLHPIGSLLVLAPFTWLFGVELGLRVGDSVFLALAGLAMLLWCRSLGLPRAASWLGALCYAVHPVALVFLGRSGQVHQPVTMAVLPLVFLAFRRLAQRPDAPRVVGAALACAALALDMQRFWLLLPFALLAALATALSGDAQTRSTAGRTVVLSALAGLGSALLLCFPVLPALLDRPNLMGHAPELLETYRRSFPLPHLLALFDRDGLVSASFEGIHAARSGMLTGSAYQGLVPLLLLMVGTLVSLRTPAASQLRIRLALVSAAASVSIALAMGMRAPLHQHAKIVSDLAEGGPGPAPWLWLFVVAVGAGSAALLMVRGLRERFALSIPVAGFAVGLGLLGLGLTAPFGWIVTLPIYSEVRSSAHFTFPLLPFLVGTAVGLVFPLLHERLAPRVPAFALVAVLALVHMLDVLPYRALLRPSPQQAAQETALRSAFAELREAPSGRMLSSDHHQPLAEWLGVVEAGKPAAWSWIPWSSREPTGTLIRLGALLPLESARRGVGAGPGEFAARTAGLANVRYLVRVGAAPLEIPADPAFRLLVERDDLQIVENLRALPYAQFYPRLAAVSGATPVLLASVVPLAFAGSATYVVVPGEPPPSRLRFDFADGAAARAIAPQATSLQRALRAPEAPPRDSPCSVVSRREPEIALDCRFDAPGYLVVAESWAPGWQARVNGEPRALHRMNLAFQGLQVSPADREIRIRYRASPLQRVSLLVAGLSWSGLLAYGVWRLRQRRAVGADSAGA